VGTAGHSNPSYSRGRGRRSGVGADLGTRLYLKIAILKRTGGMTQINVREFVS
jgi:hypothetical protein